MAEKQIRKRTGPDGHFMIDIMASSLLAEAYGMVLHDKVNDAVIKSNYGGISETKPFQAILKTFAQSALLRRKGRRRAAAAESFGEFIITAMCRGEYSEKAIRAFLNPLPQPVQRAVIEAYRRAIHDDGGPPTITEVRLQFLEENRRTRLPKDYPLRKMITKTFSLPLAKGKRGRPKTN